MQNKLKQFENQFEEYCVKKSETEYNAMLLVKQIAIDILTKEPDLDEFIMCMGSWFFTYKEDNTAYTDDSDSRVADMLNFINKYNEELNLTGMAIRVKADGQARFDW
jgi:hypothetical protein